jgi:hypothetical protein
MSSKNIPMTPALKGWPLSTPQVRLCLGQEHLPLHPVHNLQISTGSCRITSMVCSPRTTRRPLQQLKATSSCCFTAVPASEGSHSHVPTASRPTALTQRLQNRFLHPSHTRSPWTNVRVAKDAVLQLLHMCQDPKLSPRRLQHP